MDFWRATRTWLGSGGWGVVIAWLPVSAIYGALINWNIYLAACTLALPAILQGLVLRSPQWGVATLLGCYGGILFMPLVVLFDLSGLPIAEADKTLIRELSRIVLYFSLIGLLQGWVFYTDLRLQPATRYSLGVWLVINVLVGVTVGIAQIMVPLPSGGSYRLQEGDFFSIGALYGLIYGLLTLLGLVWLRPRLAWNDNDWQILDNLRDRSGIW